jgi:uncharacterized membrane protein YhhN
MPIGLGLSVMYGGEILVEIHLKIFCRSGDVSFLLDDITYIVNSEP